MIVTAEMVPWIVGGAVALFVFGYGVGHAIGEVDGEDRVARDVYERRRSSCKTA